MPWYRNQVGPRLVDRIENERHYRATSGHDAGAASLALARAFLAAGTTRIRTHVDIDTEAGLRHLHGVLATRETLRGEVEIQIVAFPQSGVLKRPGTAALLSEALAAGADLLGGADPCAIEGDPVEAVDVLFAIAERHGRGNRRSSARARIDGRVLARPDPAAHGYARHAGQGDDQPRVLSRRYRRTRARCAARADGRPRRRAVTTAPAAVPVPPVAACRAAGVTVIGGNDGVRDTWTPYGSPDMLERAMLIGMRNDFRRDDALEVALDCVTHGAARGCGFDGYGLQAGSRADVVLVDALTFAEAVVARPVRRLVVSSGKIVARDGALV